MPSRAAVPTRTHEILNLVGKLGNFPARPQVQLGSTIARTGDRPIQASAVTRICVDQVWGQERLDQATVTTGKQESQNKLRAKLSWARLQHPLVRVELQMGHARVGQSTCQHV